MEKAGLVPVRLNALGRLKGFNPTEGVVPGYRVPALIGPA